MRDPLVDCTQGLDCHVNAVMDDIYFYGPPSATFTAFDTFSQAVPTLGPNFKINLPKSVVLLPSSASPDLFSQCRERGLPYSTESLPALGTLISRDQDIISAWLVKQVSILHEPFFKALLDPRLPVQHAFLLLRQCLLPRMNYWSRVTIPSTFSDAAAAFDQMVVDTFCQRMKLPSLSDVALSQLRLPVRLGGFGLSQLSLVSSAAWYCAFANAFRLIFPLVPSWEDLSLNTPFVSAMYTV